MFVCVDVAYHNNVCGIPYITVSPSPVAVIAPFVALLVPLNAFDVFDLVAFSRIPVLDLKGSSSSGSTAFLIADSVF